MPRYADDEDDDWPRRRRSRDEDDDDDDDRPRRRRPNIKTPGILTGLAITNTVWGSLFLLCCLGNFIRSIELLNAANQFNNLFGGFPVQFGNHPLIPSRGQAFVLILFYLLLMIVAGGTLAAGIGMLNRKAWSKPLVLISSIAAGVLSLVGFIIGLFTFRGIHEGHFYGFLGILVFSIGATIFNLVVLSDRDNSRSLA